MLQKYWACTVVFIGIFPPYINYNKQTHRYLCLIWVNEIHARQRCYA